MSRPSKATMGAIFADLIRSYDEAIEEAEALLLDPEEADEAAYVLPTLRQDRQSIIDGTWTIMDAQA